MKWITLSLLSWYLVLHSDYSGLMQIGSFRTKAVCEDARRILQETFPTVSQCFYKTYTS